MLADPQWAHTFGVCRATVISLQPAQCQAGMRCPHQSWREMHQSRIFSIQLKNVLFQLSGTKTMRPEFTASRTLAASGLVLTNHCVDTSGSTTVPQRSHLLIASVYGSIFSIRSSF